MSFATVRYAVLLGLAVALTGGTALAAPGEVGTPAADFDLPIFNAGTATMTLSEHTGKVVMLDIVGYG